MASGHRHSIIVVAVVATDELAVVCGEESLCLDSRSGRLVFPCSFPHPELVHCPPSAHAYIARVSPSLLIAFGVVNPVDVLSTPLR